MRTMCKISFVLSLAVVVSAVRIFFGRICTRGRAVSWAWNGHAAPVSLAGATAMDRMRAPAVILRHARKATVRAVVRGPQERPAPRTRKPAPCATTGPNPAPTRHDRSAKSIPTCSATRCTGAHHRRQKRRTVVILTTSARPHDRDTSAGDPGRTVSFEARVSLAFGLGHKMSRIVLQDNARWRCSHWICTSAGKMHLLWLDRRFT